MAGPRLIHGTGLLIVCVGVGHGHGAELAGPAGKIRRALQLRRQIHDPQQAAGALVQLPESLKIRQAQIGAVLGSLLLFREEGPLHVDAHGPGAAGGPVLAQGHGRLKGGGQGLVGQGHGGRGKAGHAVSGEIGRHAGEALQVSVGKVRAHGAVGVDIHQPGQHLGAVQVRSTLPGAGEDPVKAAVFHSEAAGDKATVRRKDQSVSKQHLTPPGGLPRQCSGPPGGPFHREA